MLLASQHTSCFSVLALALTLVHGAAAQDTCYGFYKAGLGYPCASSSSNSTASGCCGLGNICYDNGLCRPGPENIVQDRAKGIKEYYSTYFLGGCTDPTYSSLECTAAKYCSQFDGGNGNGVRDCTNLGPNVFCCYGLSRPGCECVSDNERVFTIGSDAPTPVTTLPLTSPTYTTGGSSSSSNRTTSTRRPSYATDSASEEESTSAISTPSVSLARPYSNATTTSAGVQAPSTSLSSPSLPIPTQLPNSSGRTSPSVMNLGVAFTLLLGVLSVLAV